MYWPVWRDREWNGYHWWGFGPHNRPWHHMGGLSVVVTVGRWALELDFDLHKEIVPQDIIGIKEGSTFRNPKTKVAIKATKFQNSYLILGTADVEPENRKSDIYILTRIDLPDDHLLRIAKDELEELLKKQKHFDSYKDKLSGFEPIPCEVVGFAYRRELEKIDNTEQLAKILGTRNPSGARYVKVAGKLRDSIEEWAKIAEKL